jgi:hypothetical protein
MTRLSCSAYFELDPVDYCGPTPGPTGVNDAADPTRPDRPRGLPSRTPGSLGVCDAACTLAAGPLVLPGSQGQCSTMSPYDFMQLYRQLDVPYVVRNTSHVCHVQADVHIYVNNGLSNRRSNESEKNAIQGIVRRTEQQARRGRGAPIAADRRVHNIAIAHAFYGKGAPWEYRVYLAYALTFGRATPASLAAYCDRTAKLGLDCSGFVNSFLVSTGRVDRARDIGSYARNTARTAYAQIQPLDLLIWQGSDAGANSHIAIVDHLIAPNQMQVVESSGSKGGLAASTYTVESVAGNIFTVNRGMNGEGNAYAHPSTVKIVAYQ